MDAYLRAGFPEPFHWLMGGDVGRAALKGTTLQSPEFEARYRAAIEAILAHAKSENWPPIVFQPVDEGFEHRDRFEEMVRCMAIMKKIPGVVVEADGMNGNPAGLEDVMHLIDVFNYHDGPHLKRTVYDGPAWEAFMDRLDREGKTMWFYNIDTTAYHPEIMRFGYGFHLIRCRAKGSFCWAYQWGGKDPYVDPPGRGFNFMFRFPPFGSETGGPSTGWEGTREGVDDYRYYATYQAAADRARKRGDAAALKLIVQTDAALKAALDKIEYSNWRKPGHQGEWTGGERITPDCRRAVVGQYKLPNGWTFDDYDRLRRLLAYAILALQQGGL
ncbi:MAG: hypothetical protein FJ279_38780 [Planctomycetes bacterium]|nr:hypothetical protein [Planctomycetota bacterium]